MTDLAELVAECKARGIRLLPTGNGALKIHASHDALTAELVDRLKAHKTELLDCLRTWGNCGPVGFGWREKLDSNDLEPCARCGSVELWQTLAGTWRCQHCEGAVLERFRKLAERAARLRRGERAPPLRRERQTTTTRGTLATTAEHNVEKAHPELQRRLFEGNSSGPKGRKGQR